MRLAKQLHITLLIIGHVTKEGMVAGPKTLEHMVDTVLYLEGERFSTLRMLRCIKNRFGGTGEVGVFEMTEIGLREVKNPAALFLEHRTENVPGTCIAAVLEGNKTLLLEVQALTNPTAFGYPKRAASGFDTNRLQLLLAIMERRLKVKLSSQDVYINVAGGFELEERAADLPVVLAILSSLKNEPLSGTIVACGEVGLAGEVRGVTQVDKRIKEAAKLGFTRMVTAPTTHKAPSGMDIYGVKMLPGLEKLFSN
jgi:DNA repair protein RadA/Sms